MWATATNYSTFLYSFLTESKNPQLLVIASKFAVFPQGTGFLRNKPGTCSVYYIACRVDNIECSLFVCVCCYAL